MTRVTHPTATHTQYSFIAIADDIRADYAFVQQLQMTQGLIDTSTIQLLMRSRKQL